MAVSYSTGSRPYSGPLDVNVSNYPMAVGDNRLVAGVAASGIAYPLPCTIESATLFGGSAATSAVVYDGTSAAGKPVMKFIAAGTGGYTHPETNISITTAVYVALTGTAATMMFTLSFKRLCGKYVNWVSADGVLSALPITVRRVFARLGTTSLTANLYDHASAASGDIFAAVPSVTTWYLSEDMVINCANGVYCDLTSGGGTPYVGIEYD